MRLIVNAKINLGLNVLERRGDGFHEIESIFLPVNVQDEIEISLSENDNLFTKGSNLPRDINQNLCFKALQLLREDFTFPKVELYLKKGIPIGAGLGGGSADAAFVLKGINQQFQLGITDPQLETYAAKLGSDCIFFIKNKPALIGGRGEKVSVDESYDVLKDYHLLIVKPEVFISTKEAYAQLEPYRPKQGLKDIIQEPIESWKGLLKNDFEEHTFKNHPILQEIKNQFYQSGALYASMSGSGSALYGVFRDREVDTSPFENHWWKWAKTL